MTYRQKVIHCTLPSHQTLSFSSNDEFEIHYQKDHVNRCSACNRNFPTEHYLELHIAENHNPLNEVLKERGDKIYSCFVEDCDRKCSTPPKRRRHLIDKHLFPKNYDFFVINDGLDNRASLLRINSQSSRHVSEKTHTPVSKKVDHVGAKETANQASSKRVGSFDESSGQSMRRRTNISHNLSKWSGKESKILVEERLRDLTSSMSALEMMPRSVRVPKDREVE